MCVLHEEHNWSPALKRDYLKDNNKRVADVVEINRIVIRILRARSTLSKVRVIILEGHVTAFLHASLGHAANKITPVLWFVEQLRDGVAANAAVIYIQVVWY